MPAAPLRPDSAPATRPLLLAVAAALLALWCVGLFARTYWTPDEPREAALAASIRAHPAPLPALAGVTFAEKPPLTYWFAGAAQALFGTTPAATRAPQLLYALLGFLAVYALAHSLAGGAAALAAALLFATCELVYQVQIWLDTDALLLAGVCVALAGMYRGLLAATSGARLRAYLVMHVGLTLAFFGKNLAGWLVPVLAFAGFVAIERRWRELLRWELYAGAVLPALAIALWVLAVAAMPDGAQSLRILFWNNLVGRAVPVAAEAQYSYASGHRNWPGKYLLELLLYLLPWTVATLAALHSAWRQARGAQGVAWRFALCVALPGLLVLSLAATARGIYAAPCMIGFALLTALWAERAERTRQALRITALLIGLFAVLVLLITVGLQFTAQRASWPAFLLSLCTAGAVAWYSVRERGARPAEALVRLAVCWAALLSLGVLCLYGAMNRAQDLAGLAARVTARAAGHPLLLWQPDETTEALAQLYLPAERWSVIAGDGAGGEQMLAARLREQPDAQVLSLWRAPSWSRAQWLDYLNGRAIGAAGGVPPAAGNSSDEAPLRGAGLRISAHFTRPGGRGYLLWSQATPAVPSSPAAPD
jgi:4-amino-4-deoxy-L-arabinose transferase